ncbi:ABC transporter substrate-binding protein [Candidatus Terasakiella magnetica]|uniref:ABC transporter substrate-binding protein n=1 Tax=Candidatus Terasakiella magnetica TaxID=1867952 RepID=UPI000F840BB3|nr:ABC transporter substrate-binding protein [Candidatus Terasakiella magnetica]
MSLFLLTCVFAADVFAQTPILLGLDADMSSGSARSGIAIKRGIELAIEEVNQAGGVLGRPLKLVVKDHHGNPARGADNIEDFAKDDDMVAVLGGLHTPVALYELKNIHKYKMIYLSPWAAGTPVVENGYDPNYVFRLSVRDEYAGGFLVEKALKRGFKRIALALENTGWGRSNERAMKTALEAKGYNPVAVSWFHWGTGTAKEALGDLVRSKPDVILLVANAPEGKAIVKAMAEREESERVAIISHWGVTGGNFFAEAKEAISKVDLTFLQTYSFIDRMDEGRARQVINAYVKRYPDADNVRDIYAPVGTAHAYDLVHILAKAITQAGTIDRAKVHEALEKLPPHNGLVRRYARPFSAKKHDALDVSDFNLSKFDKAGAIIPIGLE